MGKTEKYVPKINHQVFMVGKGFVKYFVTKVDDKNHRADLKTTSGVLGLCRDVAWAKLIDLDESQNAARIIREATEGR